MIPDPARAANTCHRRSFSACTHHALSRKQRGAVLIMVLWTAVLLTILVTVLAANVRLSATTAFHHRAGSQQHLDVMAAMQQAEMELMLELMPPSLDVPPRLNELGELRISAYRFNGQPLNLHHPAPDGIRVRIYNHAGKINLNGISRRQLQALIEHRLGAGFDPREVEALLAAWADWLDPDDLLTPGGAEEEYYLALETPYRPRNSPQLESVEEIRLIRGFDTLLEGVNLQAAFTVHGNENTVNPNFATREALELLPGMTTERIEQIIAYRQQRDFQTAQDVGEVIPLDAMALLSPWLGFNSSTVFTIFAYPLAVDQAEHAGESQRGEGSIFANRSSQAARLSDRDDQRGTAITAVGEDPVRKAAMQIVEVSAFDARPQALLFDPYGQLPDSAPARAELDLNFNLRPGPRSSLSASPAGQAP